MQQITVIGMHKYNLKFDDLHQSTKLDSCAHVESGKMIRNIMTVIMLDRKDIQKVLNWV